MRTLVDLENELRELERIIIKNKIASHKSLKRAKNHQSLNEVLSNPVAIAMLTENVNGWIKDGETKNNTINQLEQTRTNLISRIKELKDAHTNPEITKAPLISI